MNERKDQLKYFEDHQGQLFGHLHLSSGNPGPQILVIGGTHGNEPCGVKAIYRWHQYLKDNPLLLKGDLHFLLGNPEAYARDLRYVDHDLNRSFSSYSLDVDQASNLESRRAREIAEFLDELNELDAVLDLHSVSKGDSQMLVYNRQQKEIFDFVVRLTPMAVHFNYNDKDIHGLLIDHCKRLSQKNFAIECGNHLDSNAHEVASYHIYRLLHLHGMLESLEKFEKKQNYVKASDNVELYETLYPIIPEPGFKFTVNHSDTVNFLEKDLVFAKHEHGELKTPSDCYLVMPPKNVRETDVDAGFLCQKHMIKRSEIV